MSVLLPSVPMDITVITPTLARLTDTTVPNISIAAFLSARVRGSTASTGAITGLVTAASGPALIAGSMAVGDSVRPRSEATPVADSGAAINSAPVVVGSGAAS